MGKATAKLSLLILLVLAGVGGFIVAIHRLSAARRPQIVIDPEAISLPHNKPVKGVRPLFEP